MNISKKQQEMTKTLQKPKNYNKVKNNTLMKADYNFMMDLLFLPETKKGFKYCCVVVDLATDEFDMEPLKGKTPSEVLKALLTMNKRPYIKIDDKGESIRTDSGNEFKGAFQKYMYEHSILHRVAQPNRHIQLANVERLNGILGKLFNGYMNGKEEETGKIYKEWTDVVPTIRDKLNEIRKKKLPDSIFEYVYPPWYGYKQLDKENFKVIEPKYNVGDLVYVGLETPEDTLGKKLHGGFRNGDYRLTKEPHKITKILYYTGPPFYRYIVNTFKGVSYQEAELRPATGETEETYKVKAIIGKKSIKKVIYYQVWWKGCLKKDATWEPKKELEKDVPDLIIAFDK